MSEATKHVEFVSYDGKYPNLCRGTLILRIDGKEVSFGWRADYNPFWCSGGSAFVDEQYDEHVSCGEWLLEQDMLPDEYKEYAREMIDEMNKHVEQGCCGGCI